MWLCVCSLIGCHMKVPDPAALRGLQITYLEWHQGEFNDVWLAVLGSLCVPLERIDLSNCTGISGSGLGALGMLKEVALNQCFAVSDAGLAAMGALTLLEKLDLSSCPKITPLGLRALRGAKRLCYLGMAHCEVSISFTLILKS